MNNFKYFNRDTDDIDIYLTEEQKRLRKNILDSFKQDYIPNDKTWN